MSTRDVLVKIKFVGTMMDLLGIEGRTAYIAKAPYDDTLMRVKLPLEYEGQEGDGIHEDYISWN